MWTIQCLPFSVLNNISCCEVCSARLSDVCYLVCLAVTGDSFWNGWCSWGLIKVGAVIIEQQLITQRIQLWKQLHCHGNTVTNYCKKRNHVHLTWVSVKKVLKNRLKTAFILVSMLKILNHKHAIFCKSFYKCCLTCEDLKYFCCFMYW